MALRKTIDIGLSPAEALAIVKKSFVADRGWTIERGKDQLLAYPSSSRNHLYEPKPDSYIPYSLPETLVVQIEAAPLPGGGARITAEVGHHRLPEYLGNLAADILLAPFGTLAYVSITYGIVRLQLRKNRRNAKNRMIRLAIEPLLPHQTGRDGGPFRH